MHSCMVGAASLLDPEYLKRIEHELNNHRLAITAQASWLSWTLLADEVPFEEFHIILYTVQDYQVEVVFHV